MNIIINQYVKRLRIRKRLREIIYKYHTKISLMKIVIMYRERLQYVLNVNNMLGTITNNLSNENIELPELIYEHCRETTTISRFFKRIFIGSSAIIGGMLYYEAVGILTMWNIPAFVGMTDFMNSYKTFRTQYSSFMKFKNTGNIMFKGSKYREDIIGYFADEDENNSEYISNLYGIIDVEKQPKGFGTCVKYGLWDCKCE